MATKEELQSVIRKTAAQLQRIENRERYGEAIGLLGKCFRTRNNYSCPEKPSDYWWLYIRVTRVATDGSLYAFEFEVDKNGAIRINPLQYMYRPDTLSRYQEITLADFKKAMKAMECKLASTCRAARGVFQTKGPKRA